MESITSGGLDKKTQPPPATDSSDSFAFITPRPHTSLTLHHHSMSISAVIKTTETSKLAVFAAGCFWGVEHIFRKNFNVPTQLVDVRVGYANGKADITNPNYKQVCTGQTDFAEAILVAYEPANVSYEQLVDFFFRIHDPTTVNSQGPDVGTQYRSGVYTTDEDQLRIANAVKNKFQQEWYPTKQIATTVEPLRAFFDGETYHQEYLFKNTDGYACPTHFVREKPQ